MLEEHKRFFPSGVADLLGPMTEVAFRIVIPAKAEVTPGSRFDPWSFDCVFTIDVAQSTVELFQQCEHFVIEPRGVAELEGDGSSERNQVEEIGESLNILAKVAGKLKEDQPQSILQRIRSLDQVFEGVPYFFETLQMRDRPGGFEDETKIRRHLLGPALEHRSFGKAVERVIDFDSWQTLGVERQHLIVLQVLRIERAFPFFVAEPAGSEAEPHVANPMGLTSFTTDTVCQDTICRPHPQLFHCRNRNFDVRRPTARWPGGKLLLL